MSTSACIVAASTPLWLSMVVQVYPSSDCCHSRYITGYTFFQAASVLSGIVYDEV